MDIIASMEKLEKLRTALEAEARELLVVRKASIEARAPVTLDQQSVGRVSRIDAMQMQALAQAQERQRALRLVRIEQALSRLESGDFGFCLDCGEEISAKRLQIDPAASRCIQCAG